MLRPELLSSPEAFEHVSLAQPYSAAAAPVMDDSAPMCHRHVPGCLHCVCCFSSTSSGFYTSRPLSRGLGFLQEEWCVKQEWWPGHCESPGVYFLMGAKRLAYMCARPPKDVPLWRGASCAPACSPLLLSRRRPPLSVRVPAAMTNIKPDEEPSVHFAGSVLVCLAAPSGSAQPCTSPQPSHCPAQPTIACRSSSSSKLVRSVLAGGDCSEVAYPTSFSVSSYSSSSSTCSAPGALYRQPSMTNRSCFNLSQLCQAAAPALPKPSMRACAPALQRQQHSLASLAPTLSSPALTNHTQGGQPLLHRPNHLHPGPGQRPQQQPGLSYLPRGDEGCRPVVGPGFYGCAGLGRGRPLQPLPHWQHSHQNPGPGAAGGHGSGGSHRPHACHVPTGTDSSSMQPAQLQCSTHVVLEMGSSSSSSSSSSWGHGCGVEPQAKPGWQWLGMARAQQQHLVVF